jgi:membrane-associated phospholipid phosphatase
MVVGARQCRSRRAVRVTTLRYNGTIHDFVILNPLSNTPAVRAAIRQATDALRSSLHGQRSRARQSPFVPVGGPLETFSDFPVPRTLPPAQRVVLPEWAELTGFPSLHFAWALLVAAAAWNSGLWARAGGVAFAVFTMTATLGLGMHWLVDLIASLPF